MSEPFLEIDAWIFQLEEFRTESALPPSDAECAAKIADPRRRQFYERGRAALRAAVADRTGKAPEELSFEVAPGGKPGVRGCEFSISHSGPWLFIALSDAPLGADIEVPRPRKNTLQLAERFFSREDFQLLAGMDEAKREDAFLRQWVAKEAAVKCAGTGLADHLHKAKCLMKESSVSMVLCEDEKFFIQEFTLANEIPGAIAWRGAEAARIRWRNAGQRDLAN